MNVGDNFELKIGDRIYCHTRVYDPYFDCYYCTINKWYEIISLEDDYIGIINDDGGNHSFSLNKNNDEYWKKWFYNIRELRKIKLKQINDCRKNLISDESR